MKEFCYNGKTYKEVEYDKKIVEPKDCIKCDLLSKCISIKHLIPQCESNKRKDKKDVYFKEVIK